MDVERINHQGYYGVCSPAADLLQAQGDFLLAAVRLIIDSGIDFEGLKDLDRAYANATNKFHKHQAKQKTLDDYRRCARHLTIHPRETDENAMVIVGGRTPSPSRDNRGAYVEQWLWVPDDRLSRHLGEEARNGKKLGALPKEK